MAADQLRIALFGSYDEKAHPRVQVLREGLLSHGAEVTVINQPIDFDTASRVRLAQRPWLIFGFLRAVARSWASLHRQARQHPPFDVVVIGYMGQFDIVLARRLFRHSEIMLDYMVGLGDTARDRRMRPIVCRILDAVDAIALRRTDRVIVDTAEHHALLAPEVRDRAVLVPVGAPSSWHAAGSVERAARSESPLRVVFFGLYTPLQGTPFLAKALAYALDAGADIETTLIGTGQDRAEVEEILAGKQITFIDWVDATELPTVVAAHDVCLGIFGATPKATRVVPNKVYQGLAAGTTVITSNTACQRAVLGDTCIYVDTDEPKNLGRVLVEMAQNGTSSVTDSRRFEPREVIRPLTDLFVPLSHTGGVTTTSDPPLTLGAWLRHDQIMDALDVAKPQSILEFGIGRGAMGARLARSASRYVGVEPDDTSRHAAERVIDSPGAVIKDSIEAIGDEQFDLVCAFEVLEHLEDDRTVLRDWREYLEPGGHLLFSVPAFPERFGPSDRMAGHLRRYDPAQLADLLSDSGFELISYAVTGAPLGFALEGARNLFAKRLLSKPDEAELDAAERTAISGRLFQPEGLGWLTRGLSAPFRRIQQKKRESGIGVVVFAVRTES